MFAAYRTCVMPPVCPASVHVAERMWVSYSAAMPEYDPAASTPLATGLYARHEIIPAPRQQSVSVHSHHWVCGARRHRLSEYSLACLLGDQRKFENT